MSFDELWMEAFGFQVSKLSADVSNLGSKSGYFAICGRLYLLLVLDCSVGFSADTLA